MGKIKYNKKLLSVLLSFNLLPFTSCNDLLKVFEEEEVQIEEESYEDYEQYFNIESEFKNVSFLSPIEKKECSFEFDGNKDNIINSIIENTKQVKEEGCTNPFDDEEQSTLIKQSLSEILDNVINSKNNTNEDMHVLSDLKIVFKNISNNQIEDDLIFYSNYDSKTNTIIIDSKGLDNYCSILKADYKEIYYQNYLYYLLSVNVNIARQNTCADEKLNETLMDDDRVNALSLGAATSEIIFNKKLGSDCVKAFSSEVHREDEGELLTLTLLNQDKNVTDKYYQALFDEDYETLYQLFNLKTEEDKNNFSNIIKAIDAKNNYNNKSFAEVGYDYKLLIYQMFVNNMIKYMNENNITLFDNLVLYNISLSALINDIDFNNASNKEIIEKFYYLDTKYKEMLCKYYKVDNSDVSYLNDTRVKNILRIMGDRLYLNMDIADDTYDKEYADSFLEKYPMANIIMSSDLIHPSSYSIAVTELGLNR